MKFLPNSILMIALICGMLGCTSVVPGSLLTLQRTSPLEADPQQIAARIDLPDGLGIVPGSAQLTLVGERLDTGETLSGVYTFAVHQGQSALFRFSESEATRLAKQQSTLRAWKAAAGDNARGSLSVDITPCRIAEGPTDDARVSVDLQLDTATGFLPLIRNGSISAIAKPETLQDLTACAVPL